MDSTLAVVSLSRPNRVWVWENRDSAIAVVNLSRPNRVWARQTKDYSYCNISELTQHGLGKADQILLLLYYLRVHTTGSVYDLDQRLLLLQYL